MQADLRVCAVTWQMEAYRMKRQQTDDPLANLGTSGSKGYDLV